MPGSAQHFRWADLPVEHLRGGITRRYVTSAKAMIGEVALRKGDTVPPHAHENEQFTHVVRGALRFRLGTDGVVQKPPFLGYTRRAETAGL